MENSKEKKELTLGENRVRIDFNLASIGSVNVIKQKSAMLINICDEMKPKEGEKVEPEKLRLIALAQTAFEEAAMWAVKAATF